MSTFLAELISYVGLGERDRALLVELHPRLAPHFPSIAEKLHAGTIQFDSSAGGTRFSVTIPRRQ